MMDRTVEAVGPQRMLFGTDITMGTGWGKLRYLESLGLGDEALDRIRYRNAQSIFPQGVFG
jgi:predicted TIM-barrel fold metal-dependent hydrolase